PHTDILQTDRVDHPGSGLVHTRWRIAFHRLAREAFHHQAAERVQIHQLFEFHAVGECAGSRQHRIAQPNPAQSCGQVSAAGLAHSTKASPSTRPIPDEGAETPMARASVAATSTDSTGPS